jgi:hypothetical protein
MTLVLLSNIQASTPWDGYAVVRHMYSQNSYGSHDHSQFQNELSHKQKRKCPLVLAI